ncbi:MAG: response regulator [Spirochaetales bacterium]|nr:response regulator [Spirochaetales bacterium]
MSARILIIDDFPEITNLFGAIIRNSTDYIVVAAHNGEEALEILKNEEKPDLILLDINMPGMDGFEVADHVKHNASTRDIPIIFITGMTDSDNIVRAFEKGGVDYIPKPCKGLELLARVNVQIKLKKLHDELIVKNEELEIKNKILSSREEHLLYLVEEKTKKIENLTYAMVSALENVNVYNDSNTGSHIMRVGLYSELLAKKYGCDQNFVKRIKIYATLHDIGKVGIEDSLLKKPDKYTEPEFEKIKDHVVIGFNMLNSPEIDEMAKNIALYHHEKWDGSGYMHHLKGYEIPLEARIVALADVFDALTTSRHYKGPFTEKEAIDIIKENSNKHFEPQMVDLFLDSLDEITRILNDKQLTS